MKMKMKIISNFKRKNKSDVRLEKERRIREGSHKIMNRMEWNAPQLEKKFGNGDFEKRDGSSLRKMKTDISKHYFSIFYCRFFL